MTVKHEIKSQLAKLLATEDLIVEHKQVSRTPEMEFDDKGILITEKCVRLLSTLTNYCFQFNFRTA